MHFGRDQWVSELRVMVKEMCVNICIYAVLCSSMLPNDSAIGFNPAAVRSIAAAISRQKTSALAAIRTNGFIEFYVAFCTSIKLDFQFDLQFLIANHVLFVR